MNPKGLIGDEHAQQQRSRPQAGDPLRPRLKRRADAKKGNSIDGQLDEIKDYAEEHGWEIAAVESDSG